MTWALANGVSRKDMRAGLIFSSWVQFSRLSFRQLFENILLEWYLSLKLDVMIVAVSLSLKLDVLLPWYVSQLKTIVK